MQQILQIYTDKFEDIDFLTSGNVFYLQFISVRVGDCSLPYTHSFVCFYIHYFLLLFIK